MKKLLFIIAWVSLIAGCKTVSHSNNTDDVYWLITAAIKDGQLENVKSINKESREQIVIESQYSGYLKRQKNDIVDFVKDEQLLIPQNINYKKIGSLSNEVVEKLSLIKPPTLGAASRISGVTPAAVIALLRHVKRKKNEKVV